MHGLESSNLTHNIREDHMNSSETKPLKVAFLGLGYVGLPVAQQAVAAGFSEVGFRSTLTHNENGGL